MLSRNDGISDETLQPGYSASQIDIVTSGPGRTEPEAEPQSVRVMPGDSSLNGPEAEACL